MIGRRAVAGLSLLSALVFCAFAAQSASAVNAIDTTANTCVPTANNTGDFKDEHCDVEGVKGKEKYAHAVITEKKTKTSASNDKVTEETKKSEPATLKGKVGLTKTEVHCNKVKNNVEKSYIENVETEKKHNLEGTAFTEFTECSVSQPEKCKVKEPVVSEATFKGVEGLTGPKGEANAMGVEFTGEGPEKTFAELTYEGAECALKGKSFKVKGSVVATSGPTTESAQTNRHAGATLVFTHIAKMQSELKLGVDPAEFTTIVTPTMDGGNPI